MTSSSSSSEINRFRFLFTFVDFLFLLGENLATPLACFGSEVSDFEDRDIGNMQMDQVKTIEEGEHKKVKNLEYKVITNRLINS